MRFVGGSVPDALATTRRMHEITLGENPRWTVPVLEFQGVADRHRRHPGVPHRHPAPDQHRHGRAQVAGVGQVGAGLVTPPAEIFPAALARLAELAPGRGPSDPPC